MEKMLLIVELGNIEREEEMVEERVPISEVEVSRRGEQFAIEREGAKGESARGESRFVNNNIYLRYLPSRCREYATHTMVRIKR